MSSPEKKSDRERDQMNVDSEWVDALEFLHSRGAYEDVLQRAVSETQPGDAYGV